MLQRPTPEYVAHRLSDFEKYEDAEASMNLVFSMWPSNKQIDQVLAKVVLLNRLSSTSIFDVHSVARHIVAQNIDEDIQAGAIELVPKIAHVTMNNGKTRNNYSFATKYCARHEPDRFQIYDSQVDVALCQYKKQFNFAQFKRGDLKDYAAFMAIIDLFISHFGLDSFSRKQLDMFLWLEGKAKT